MNSTAHDTINLTQVIDVPVAEVWEAYADSAKRAQWGVPAGEGMVYDESDFREGGRDRYRCGPPDTLEFHAETEYTRIVPRELVVCTETVRSGGQPLATAVLTWEFASDGAGTLVTITSQVVSFVGAGMIEGNRNGHTKALKQFGQFLAEA